MKHRRWLAAATAALLLCGALAEGDAGGNLSADSVYHLELRLAELGFFSGKSDTAFDEETRAALEAFQQAQPEGNVFASTLALISRYFYDPNSPVRSEDLYLPFVSRLAASEFVPDEEKSQYAWEKQVCSLNRTGTPAADFRFVDTAGRTRTLYGIKAEWLLLIFGNPDCKACREIMEDMGASAAISNLINSGRLKVVDVYIDEDIDLWKERMDNYPSAWINGYDPTFTIRTDRIYAVRAVPSLYLLDKDKTVVLKDAPAQWALEVLESL